MAFKVKLRNTCILFFERNWEMERALNHVPLTVSLVYRVGAGHGRTKEKHDEGEGEPMEWLVGVRCDARDVTRERSSLIK